MSTFFASKILECYFLQEKNEDENDLLHGAFEILDEFVEAFGKNADKNINIILEKIYLLKRAGDHASEHQIALDLYDLALNIHSRFLGDDETSYAYILLSKTMKISDHGQTGKSEELIESFNKCLKIFYDDEENYKKELLQVHRELALIYADDVTSNNFDDNVMHGRKTIKLEREVYGEIRRNGPNGFKNCHSLVSLGKNICYRSMITSQKLKKIDFDEATGYLLEALAIADSHPFAPPLYSATTYLRFGTCEYVKGGKTNFRKALDYVVRGSLISSKIDRTEKVKEVIKSLERLSKLIDLEIMF